jgi:hypothetical protein
MKQLSRRDVLLSAAAVPALSMIQAPVSAEEPLWSLPPQRAVREIANAWIPMSDGVRLSARVWTPTSDDGAPAPVVLEYIPYRKRDGYRFHDDIWGPTLASYGIAYARVDVRGSGDSEGVMTDEYSQAELTDGVACIEWLARQPWSSGAVGMRGLSWGGINTLQIAALDPPSLKAIMPMGCCDNRFTDDAHYVGGALGHTNFQWGILFKGVMAGPPDPEIVGVDWERQWRERLEATPAILHTWLSHQRFDTYWRRGSVAIDYEAIKVPCYIVGGWQDTYSNPIGRLLASLKVPRKGLIGPWGHTYPWLAAPLGLDWVYEEVRWWEHWLKGTDTGIMDEPMFRAFMNHEPASKVIPAEIPGRWIAESTWPPRTEPLVFHLNRDGLSSAPGRRTRLRYRGDRIVGLTKPEWLDRPPIEQSIDDARSLTFDSEILERDVEVLGHPVIQVRVGADQPVASIAVRVTEVTPEGRSWLVTYGLRNLTHRDSHETPVPLAPGRDYDVQLPLFFIGHRFSRGNRIRVAISESLWPLAWPSPRVATLTLTVGAASSLTLPERLQQSTALRFTIPELRTPPAADAPRPTAHTAPVAPGHYSIRNDADLTKRTIEAVGSELSRGSWEASDIHEGDPGSCRWTHRTYTGWKRGPWDCAVEAAYELRATESEFLLSESLTARKGGEVIFERRFDHSVPRDLV